MTPNPDDIEAVAQTMLQQVCDGELDGTAVLFVAEVILAEASIAHDRATTQARLADELAHFGGRVRARVMTSIADRGFELVERHHA